MGYATQQKYAIATAFHIERAKVKGIINCSWNSSWRIWAAVKLTPGPKHMVGPFLVDFWDFKLVGYHQRWREPDERGLDFECLDCCCGCWQNCMRDFGRRRGFWRTASSILTCLVSQRSIAESFSSIGGCSNIGRLPNLSIRPSTRLWRYPLKGHEHLLMTSLMNYFPWQ